MAGRRKTMFVMPDEFAMWLPPIAKSLGACIILDHRPRCHFAHWAGDAKTLVSAWRVYLSMEPTDLSQIRPTGLVSQALGWIDIDVPKQAGFCLQQIYVMAKSDWFVDVATGWRENPEVLKLFDRFWRQWRKHFKYGLETRSEGVVFHRDMGYSLGAAEWARSGGILCPNIGELGRFYLPD